MGRRGDDPVASAEDFCAETTALGTLATGSSVFEIRTWDVIDCEAVTPEHGVTLSSW